MSDKQDAWTRGAKTSLATREIKQVEGGYFDKFGFYMLPHGGKFPNSLLPLFALFPSISISLFA